MSRRTSSAAEFSRADVVALTLLALFFLLNIIGTWQKWTQPLIDHGREMNLPARILAGEQLYNDVQFLYGPFAPHFNAALYRIFGIHLTTLKVSGAICAVIILLLVYWLARHLMGVREAFLTTAVVIVTCALKSTANYLQPYAYSALYALVFALFSLLCTLTYLRLKQKKWITWSGAFCGLILITKPEVALAALAAAFLALLFESIASRRLRWRDILSFAIPALIVTIFVYGLVLRQVPLKVLLDDNHILFTNMPPQLVYFNQYVSGIGKLPGSLWFTLTGIGIFALWVGAAMLVGALTAARRQNGRAGLLEVLKIGGLLLLVGVICRLLIVGVEGEPRDVTPFASAIIILPLLIVWVGRRIWQRWRSDGEIQETDKTLLILSVFSFIAILRVIINVTISSPYTPFFLPVLIIVYLYLFFRVSGELLIKNDSIRASVRRAAIWLIAILVIGMAINSANRLRKRDTFLVSAPRGSFIAEEYFAQPVAEAIGYVREHSSPGEYVLTLPQATTINFMSERRYPLAEEIVHPGFLSGEKEIEAIERIKSRNVRMVVVANILTTEFHDRVFGSDYNQVLMGWIDENYHVVKRFELPPPPRSGHIIEPFFVTVYERN